MSFTTMLALLVSSMLIYSAPLIFTSIGGTFSERAGVVNVGLEGIMVMGHFLVFSLTLAFQRFSAMLHHGLPQSLLDSSVCFTH